MNTASIMILLSGLTGVCLLLTAAWWLWGLGPGPSPLSQPLSQPTSIPVPTNVPPSVAAPDNHYGDERTQFEAPPPGVFEAVVEAPEAAEDEPEENGDGQTMVFSKGEPTQLLSGGWVDHGASTDVPAPLDERVQTKPIRATMRFLPGGPPEAGS